MKTIKTIIREEILGFKEGVGDAYAEKRFGISNRGQEFGNQWNRELLTQHRNSENGKLVGMVYGSSAGSNNSRGSNIYMNPQTLKNFEPEVRAITDVQGNLYVAQLDADLIHASILNMIKSDIDFQYMPWIRAGQSNTFKSSMGGMMTRENQHKSFQSLREKQPYVFNW